MRPIDADALCAHIEKEFDGVCVYDGSGNEAAREFCDMVDIAPTIDAIPVEWLRKVRNDDKLTLDDVETIDLLLAWWQKGQVARDG